MKLRDLMIKLEVIRDKHGDDMEVEFDTEAAEYTCHMIPVDGVHFDDLLGLTVNLSTSQEESRRHCTEHRVIGINNNKKAPAITVQADSFVCTKCGKLLGAGTPEELKELMGA